MKFARLAPAAAALVALAATVGCSPTPTTAAQVGGTTISESELSASLEDCLALGLQANAQQVLVPLVIGEIMDQVGDQYGTPVPEDLIRQMADSDPSLSAVYNSDGCDKVARAQITYSLLISELGDQAVHEAVNATDVQVNPRYGEWDPQRFSIDGSGSLSVPEGN